MRIGSRACRSLVLASAMASMMLVPTAVVAEDTCQEPAPQRPVDVQGVTWTGTVLRDEAVGKPDDLGIEQWVIVFDVERVYANAHRTANPYGQRLSAGHRFRVGNSSCGRPGNLGLTVGEHYLFSTAAFLGDVTPPQGTAAWLLDGSHAALVDMYPTSDPATVFSDATDIEAALALVAPNAGLPPTDVAADKVSGPPLVSALLVVGFLLTCASLIARPMRRRGW